MTQSNLTLKLADFMYNRQDESKLFLARKKEVFEKYEKTVRIDKTLRV